MPRLDVNVLGSNHRDDGIFKALIQRVEFILA